MKGLYKEHKIVELEDNENFHELIEIISNIYIT